MRWIDDYQVFLFDFDGLLVNTEEVHYHAYQLACKAHGWVLPWTFPEYCTMAHYHADALKDAMTERFPDLKTIGWDDFYKLKTETIFKLAEEGQVRLMPGVERFLLLLQSQEKRRSVVTHSPDRLVKIIRDQNPILNTIPIWITRELYTHPKPHPECYQTAIERLATDEDRVVGFEDTPRGLKALMGTRATPILVTQIPYPEIPEFLAEGVRLFPTFEAVLDNGPA